MYAITFIFTSNAHACCPRKPSKKRHWPATCVSVTAKGESSKEGLGEAFFLAMSACFWPPRGRLKGIFASIWQETSTRFPPGSFFYRKAYDQLCQYRSYPKWPKVKISRNRARKVSSSTQLEQNEWEVYFVSSLYGRVSECFRQSKRQETC